MRVETRVTEDKGHIYRDWGPGLIERNHLLWGPKEVPRGLAVLSVPHHPSERQSDAWVLLSGTAHTPQLCFPVPALLPQPTHLQSPLATQGGHGTGDLGE